MARNYKMIAGLALAELFLSAGWAGAQPYPGCNTQSLRGSYGLLQNGSVPGLGSFVGAGVVTFDGDGSVTGSSVNNFSGTISEIALTGSYTVNRNCTGSMAYTFPNGAPGSMRFVIVDNGKEILAVETTPLPGLSATHLMKRQ